jgi:hypothetical protein
MDAREAENRLTWAANEASRKESECFSSGLRYLLETRLCNNKVVNRKVTIHQPQWEGYVTRSLRQATNVLPGCLGVLRVSKLQASIALLCFSINHMSKEAAYVWA